MSSGPQWVGWIYKGYMQLHSSSLDLILPQIHDAESLNVSHKSVDGNGIFTVDSIIQWSLRYRAETARSVTRQRRISAKMFKFTVNLLDESALINVENSVTF
jgi:hypothetical protein